MKKQTVAFSVLPAVPWGTEERCITLEAGFARQLLGLCGVLTLYRMWDGTDEEIALVQAQVEKGIAALMGCGCFEGVTSVVPTRSGYTRVSYTDGRTELISGKSASEQAENYPTEQPTFPPGGNVCAGARMLVDRILADLNFAIQQAQLVLAEFELAVETANSILNLLAFVGAPIGSILDPWSEWVFEAGDVGILVIQTALNDPAVISKMTENIYCGVMESGGHQLSLSIYNNAMVDLPMLSSTSTLLAHLFRGFDTTVSEPSYSVAERYYNLGTLNSDNTCAAEFTCDEEVFCFDVPSDTPAGISYNNANISLITGGWTNSSGVATAFVRVNFAADVVIHSITGKAAHTAANNADQAIRLNWNGAEQMRVINENNDAIYALAPFTAFGTYADPDGTVVDQVVFQAFAAGAGTIKWEDVRICYSYVV